MPWHYQRMYLELLGDELAPAEPEATTTDLASFGFNVIPVEFGKPA